MPRELDPRDAQWLISSMKRDHIALNIPINWQTPDEYLNAARELMGDIDIDPASSERAQERIKAKVYYTKDTNGLDKSWFGKLLLCPPYGKEILEQFCEKAIVEYNSGNVTEGVIITNTNTTQAEFFNHVLGVCSAICLVKGCIKWVAGHEKEQQAIDRMGINWHAEYDDHGCIVFYLGPNVDGFKRIFSKFGVCLCPMKS